MSHLRLDKVTGNVINRQVLSPREIFPPFAELLRSSPPAQFAIRQIRAKGKKQLVLDEN